MNGVRRARVEEFGEGRETHQSALMKTNENKWKQMKKMNNEWGPASQSGGIEKSTTWIPVVKRITTWIPATEERPHAAAAECIGKQKWKQMKTNENNE